MVDLAAEFKRSRWGNQKRRRNRLLPRATLKKGMKGVFGFSIKTAGGGKPIVEPFGNIKKTPKGPTVEEEREPITDVFDEKDEIRVYAEMPGVNQEDIKLDIKGRYPGYISSKQGIENTTKRSCFPQRYWQKI